LSDAKGRERSGARVSERKTKGKLEVYLEKKRDELSDLEKQQIRTRIEAGDGNVYKLAKEFGCVPTQIAGIKAWMK
jgi:transposase-like protein